MIRSDLNGGVLWLTIDRPDKRNALTADMLRNLAETVEGAECAALVLTGSGKVFSAGADLEEVRNGTLATDPVWERLSAAVASFRGLSIAALNGTAAGGSLGMVLAADLRVAVPGAEFFYPVMKMGVLPQPSDPARLAALAGPAHAKRLLLGGARIGAREALAIRLIDEIVPASQLTSRVDALCAPAESRGQEAVAAIKDLF